MQRLTLDASVILKWFLRTPDEADLAQARKLLMDLRAGRIVLIQPTHTVLEVAAVLARKSPERAIGDVDKLRKILKPAAFTETMPILRRAVEMSRTLDHHMFDTLYHAIALEYGATLITADERYYRKATGYFCIALLSECAG
jgi:predicted nucleic acid-binding protein